MLDRAAWSDLRGWPTDNKRSPLPPWTFTLIATLLRERGSMPLGVSAGWLDSPGDAVHPLSVLNVCRDADQRQRGERKRQAVLKEDSAILAAVRESRLGVVAIPSRGFPLEFKHSATTT